MLAIYVKNKKSFEDVLSKQASELKFQIFFVGIKNRKIDWNHDFISVMMEKFFKKFLCNFSST